MPEEKASYALIGILLLVISIFVLAASFIPFWGARVLYVAIPIFFAALVVLVLGIQKKVKVGLLIGTVVLSLIASIFYGTLPKKGGRDYTCLLLPIFSLGRIFLGVIFKTLFPDIVNANDIQRIIKVLMQKQLEC